MKSYLSLFFFLLSLVLLSNCSSGDEEAPAPVEVDWRSSAKYIKNFDISFEGRLKHDSIKVKIDTLNGKIDISVPFDFDVTSVIPFIEISEKSTVSPLSGVQQDFTMPVKYIVIAENETIKEFYASITRRPQANISNILYDVPYHGTNGATCDWGDTLIISAKNIIRFLKDEQGQPVKNFVAFINNDTGQEFELLTNLVCTSRTTPCIAHALRIVIPDDFPRSKYLLRVKALEKFAMSKNTIYVNYPDPTPLQYPSIVKIGSTVEIKGRYFTNIPRGSNNKPRVRVTKLTNLVPQINSLEWEVISYTETSVVVKINGYADPTDYILEGTTLLSFYSYKSNFWTLNYKYPIKLVE